MFFGSALYVMSHQPSLDESIRSAAQKGLIIVAEIQMNAIKKRADFGGMSDDALLVWVGQVISKNQFDEMTAILMEVMSRRSQYLIKALLAHTRMEVRYYMIYSLLCESPNRLLIGRLWLGQKNDIDTALSDPARARDVLTILYLFAQYGVVEARSSIQSLKDRGWFLEDMKRIEAVFFPQR